MDKELMDKELKELQINIYKNREEYQKMTDKLYDWITNNFNSDFSLRLDREHRNANLKVNEIIYDHCHLARQLDDIKEYYRRSKE